MAAAKRPLRPGEALDGEGGFTVYGLLVEAAQASSQGLVPIGLCHDAKVVRPIKEDQMLRYQDVEMPEGGFARRLRG